MGEIATPVHREPGVVERSMETPLRPNCRWNAYSPCSPPMGQIRLRNSPYTTNPEVPYANLTRNIFWKSRRNIKYRLREAVCFTEGEIFYTRRPRFCSAFRTLTSSMPKWCAISCHTVSRTIRLASSRLRECERIGFMKIVILSGRTQE